MHLILPATCPWGLNEKAVLAALLFKSKTLPAVGKRDARLRAAERATLADYLRNAKPSG